MFKNDYKSAIDSIDISDAQSRVIKAVEKGRKHKTPYYTYFAAAAAAVICIFTAVIALQPGTDTKGTAVLNNAPVTKKAEIEKQIAPADVPENVEELAEAFDYRHTVTETDITDSISTPEPQKAESEKSTTTQKNEVSPVYVMMDVNQISSKVARSVSVPMMAADVSMNADTAIPETASEKAIFSGGGSSASGGSGGGASSADETAVIPEISFSSYEQYCEYSGTDILGKISVPSGMSANEFTGVPLNTDGKIENADYTFSFSGNGKEISVTLTEDSFAESYLNDEAYKKSVFGETEAVITRSDPYCNAYFMFGGFSYDVRGFNITDEELKTAVLSVID